MYGLHSEQVWTGPGPGQAGLHVLQEEGQGLGSHVTHHITPSPHDRKTWLKASYFLIENIIFSHTMQAVSNKATPRVTKISYWFYTYIKTTVDFMLTGYIMYA